MNSKFPSAVFLVSFAVVIMLLTRNSCAQFVPDVMESIHRAAATAAKRHDDQLLMLDSEEISGFRTLIKSFDLQWPSNVVNNGLAIQFSENVTQCSNDLAVWLDGIMNKAFWSLSSK